MFEVRKVRFHKEDWDGSLETDTGSRDELEIWEFDNKEKAEDFAKKVPIRSSKNWIQEIQIWDSERDDVWAVKRSDGNG